MKTMPDTQCSSCNETSSDPDDFCDGCDQCIAWCCTCVVTSADGLLAILAVGDDGPRRPGWVSTALVVTCFVVVLAVLAVVGLAAADGGWFR